MVAEEARGEEAEFAGWRVTFHSARRGGGSFVLRNCLNFPATTKDHCESLVGDTLRSTLEGEREEGRAKEIGSINFN